MPLSFTISEIQQNIGRKSLFLTQHLVPTLKVTPLEIRRYLWIRNLQSMGYRTALFAFL